MDTKIITNINRSEERRVGKEAMNYGVMKH